MSRNESQHVVRAIRERVDDMHVGVRSLDTEDALAVFFFFYFKIIFLDHFNMLMLKIIF
jgi:hypothetical protein